MYVECSSYWILRIITRPIARHIITTISPRAHVIDPPDRGQWVVIIFTHGVRMSDRTTDAMREINENLLAAA